jgi:hypothetical protein
MTNMEILSRWWRKGGTLEIKVFLIWFYLVPFFDRIELRIKDKRPESSK